MQLGKSRVAQVTKILSKATRGIWLTASLLFALALCPQAFADSVSYVYDSLNRLTSVTYGSSVTIAYTYDAAGNRSSTTRRTAPGAPTAVSATAGNASITVNFGAPASNGNATITGYTAVCTSSNGGVSGSNTGGASATSIQVSGLTSGKIYTCTVTASNSVGPGPESAPSNTVTPKRVDLTPILMLLLD
jgi:YD repeat-containing protein